MGHHLIPQGHKELLQGILKELIKMNYAETGVEQTFEEIQPEPITKPKPPGIGES